MVHRLSVVLLLTGSLGVQAAAQEVIGAVSHVQGEASGTRGNAARPQYVSLFRRGDVDR